ncbi:MAG TPA: hypothetical protein VL261_02810 [Nitrospira sp.]|nr:hypothetical protein [Nitrospira sp.]
MRFIISAMKSGTVDSWSAIGLSSHRQRVPCDRVQFRVSSGFVLALWCLVALSACGLTSQQRVLYNLGGIQVGIVTDRTTDERASPAIINRHPADYTPRDIRSLINSLEVSGWSGLFIGAFATPQPKPVFTPAEVLMLADPLAAAFHQTTPRERVFFSIQNPDAPYDSDRTSGSLFFRDEYLHVILTDHYALLKADPGGGETRDPRDDKGMRLWVVAPAAAAVVPTNKEPHWTAFEKVHISLKPQEVLAAQAAAPAKTASDQKQLAVSATEQPAVKGGASTATAIATESANDLRLQIRELTSANLELRSRMKEQSDTITELKAQLEQLRNELGTGTTTLERKPSKKPAAP